MGRVERMSRTKYWRLQSGYRECWPSWNRHHIISVGWDVGDVRRIQDRTGDTSQTKQEIKERLDDTFGDKESWSEEERNNAAGIIRSVAGIRGNSDRNMTKGDEVVVLGKKIRGESVVHGVATLGDYRYDKYDVEEDDHPYQREAHYRAKGPVRIRDLPDQFQDLQFRGTLAKYEGADDETIERLVRSINAIVEEKGPIEPREQYFDYGLLDESALQKYIRDYPTAVDQRIVDVNREHSFEDDTRVDHLCTLELGDILGIEVKRETAPPAAVDQLSGYLDNIASEQDSDKEVFGLLVAEDFREDTIERARKEGIELSRYNLSVDFKHLL